MNSFTIFVNYEYKFIGGGVSVPEGMECMVSSAQVPYGVFNIPNACNHNFLRVSFPTGSGARLILI